MSNLRFSFTDKTISHLNFKTPYVVVSNYEGDWKSNIHTHHFTELFYVIKGSGEFQIEDKRIPVKEADLIIINPHIEHTEYSSEDSPMEFIAISIEGMNFNFEEQFPGQNYALYHCEHMKHNLMGLIRLLINEADMEKDNYEIVCKNVIEVLVIYLMRQQNLHLQQSLDTKMSKECGTAKRYIDQNYMENITLDLLAELTHMNKFYLVHSFTKYTGLSPINYLTQKRIQIAMDLLASTDYSIAQVASNVGFSSQSYFSQVFRKALGMTPVQYRKKQLKDISPLNTIY